MTLMANECCWSIDDVSPRMRGPGRTALVDWRMRMMAKEGGSTECGRRRKDRSNSLWPFGRMGLFDPLGVSADHCFLPRFSVGLAPDPLYFHVEDVEGYAWAKESLELVEKQESYGGLKLRKP
ncbi:hypothetical protein E3N88_26593 [Mikania micrantha]|uniref:Uncharacterized protein n=1 Tax=Mikania micrantha TaxID=192012 RepID=A0A5N6MXA2_9ASTR|nr:hypothetical protein E3N88_26593 [Mikania micrantha]